LVLQINKKCTQCRILIQKQGQYYCYTCSYLLNVCYTCSEKIMDGNYYVNKIHERIDARYETECQNRGGKSAKKNRNSDVSTDNNKQQLREKYDKEKENITQLYANKTSEEIIEMMKNKSGK